MRSGCRSFYLCAIALGSVIVVVVVAAAVAFENPFGFNVEHIEFVFGSQMKYKSIAIFATFYFLLLFFFVSYHKLVSFINGE